MTNPHDPTDLDAAGDPALEARLRTLLADRAATVAGPAPELPSTPSLHELVPSHRRGRWVVVGAAAAAVALLAVGAAVAIGDDGGAPDHVTATQPTTVLAPTDTTPPLPVFGVEGGTDPEQIARTYLLARLGDGTTQRTSQLEDEIRVEAHEPTEHRGVDGTVPVTWHLDGEPAIALDTESGPAEMTIWVHGDAVLESTIEGVDLSGIEHGQRNLSGTVDLPASAGGAGNGRDSMNTATLSRRGGAPLLEPDAPVSVEPGGSVRQALPIDEPFDQPLEASGDVVVTVRSWGDGGSPVAVAERGYAQPDDPEMAGWEDLTEAERIQKMTERLDQQPSASELPGCVEAGAFQMPDPVPYPEDVVPTPGTASEDVIAAGTTPGATPAQAIDALADALGISWQLGDLNLASANGAYATTRLPGGRLVDLGLWLDPDTESWTVTEARTRGACRDFGGSNLTPLGAPNPKTRFGLPIVKGATSGDLWYRTADGTERAAVTPTDIGAHFLSVAVDQGKVTGRAEVLRDAAGDAVLVDVSRDGASIPS